MGRERKNLYSDNGDYLQDGGVEVGQQRRGRALRRASPRPHPRAPLCNKKKHSLYYYYPIFYFTQWNAIIIISIIIISKNIKQYSCISNPLHT